MQIIIVGCGKVGRTLAEQLQEEDTDITLIDINPDRINEITDAQIAKIQKIYGAFWN